MPLSQCAVVVIGNEIELSKRGIAMLDSSIAGVTKELDELLRRKAELKKHMDDLQSNLDSDGREPKKRKIETR